MFVNNPGLLNLTPPIKNSIQESNLRREDFDVDAPLIYQRGFGIVREGKLGTAGLGPCIAWVVFVEGEKNLLLLAHFDTMTDLEGSVSTIVSWLKYAGINGMNCVHSTLIGGDPSSKQLRKDLSELLNQFGFKGLEDLNPDSDANTGPRRFVVSASEGRFKKM